MKDSCGVSSHEERVTTTSAILLQMMWQLRRTAGEVFETLDLTLVQAAILLDVASGTTQPKALAESLGLHFTAVSALLLKLETLNLIERRTARQDHRYVDIVLTSAGRQQVADIKQAWEQASTPNLTALSDDELQQLTQLCLKVLR